MRRRDGTMRDDDARIDFWATSCQVPSTPAPLPPRAPVRVPLVAHFGPVALLRVYRAMRQVNASFMPMPSPLSVSVSRVCSSSLPLSPGPFLLLGRLAGPGPDRVTTGTTECQISPCPDLSCHRAPAACHAVPMPCHPSCFDTSLAQHLWYHQDYHHTTARQRDHHRTAHTTTICYYYHYHLLLHLHQPWRPAHPSTLPSCPPRPTTITGACASTDPGDGPRPCEIPPRAIDTASSAITQNPRAIDLKLGPPAAGQRRRPRPHQTLPDLTSAGQGFDRSAIVPVYYACTTSFTSPPTAALPSVRDGADPWSAARLHFGHRDAISLVRMLDLAAVADTERETTVCTAAVTG